MEAKLEVRLVDVWRCLHTQTFTFDSDAHKVSSRLDYFFMLKRDLSKVAKCEIYP